MRAAIFLEFGLVAKMFGEDGCIQATCLHSKGQLTDSDESWTKDKDEEFQSPHYSIPGSGCIDLHTHTAMAWHQEVTPQSKAITRSPIPQHSWADPHNTLVLGVMRVAE